MKSYQQKNNSMLIGIDGNEANVDRKVGIGQYAYNLLVYLHSHKTDSFRIYLKDVPRKDLPSEEGNWHYRQVFPRFLWTKLGLPWQLLTEKEKPDVFFSPSHYSPLWTPCKKAISIMDLSYLVYPEMFNKKDLYQLTEWTRKSVLQADKIFTISKFSKSEILKHYGISNDKVVVTYPGFDKLNFNSVKKYGERDMLKNKYGINKNYILFVGTVQPRKNIIRLLEAYEKLVPENENISLVLIGKKGWKFEETFERLENNSKKKDIIVTDYVDAKDLPVFYRNAELFILPSLYEGFGIPVVEAFACGCPVVTSNISSLPEIAGDASLLINPNSETNILEGIRKIIRSHSFRNALVEKGLKRAKNFSWRLCADQTLSVLKEIGR